MKTKTLLFIAILLIFKMANSTPNSAVWENEILIGVTENYYYTMKLGRYFPSNYFQYADSLFLFEKELNTGKVTEKTILRVIHHNSAEIGGKWEHIEMVKNPLNLIQYQMEKKMEFAFKVSFPDTKFKINKKGLFLKMGKDEEILLNKTYVDKYVGWIDDCLTNQIKYPDINEYQIRVLETYAAAGYIFLVVESGANNADSDFRQTLLVFKQEIFYSAQQKINERIK